MGSPVQLRTCQGLPITSGDVVVIPESRALVIRLPFARLVWNRPVSVLTEHAGQTVRLRVVDLTRVAQVSLLVGAGLWALLRLRRPG
jgi:hypothetical protein